MLNREFLIPYKKTSRLYLHIPLAFLSSSRFCSGTLSLHGVDWNDAIALHNIHTILLVSTALLSVAEPSLGATLARAQARPG
jgi:hypothetical protein